MKSMALTYVLVIYVFVMLSLIGLASAATIYGTVYDLSLKKADNARVEINTHPKQFVIAKNGTYSFNVPNGNYALKAELVQNNVAVASAKENLTIRQDGFYVLDLILFPDIEEGVEEIDIDIDENVVESNNRQYAVAGSVIFLTLALILLALYYFNKRKKAEAKKTEGLGGLEDLGQIIKIIRQEGGRTTQKEIRKLIPLSEAKISLMIAELEHKGLIEKIKKGRGNIIILKIKNKNLINNSLHRN